MAHKLGSKKTRSKGLSANRSAENILHRMDEESVVAAQTDSSSESIEVSFEIRKKYNVQQMDYYCVENAKRTIRRAKSNDSLLMKHQIVVRKPNHSATQPHEKTQTLPGDLSKSRETLDDRGSSADTTTSDDTRSESCGSSILDSEQ